LIQTLTGINAVPPAHRRKGEKVAINPELWAIVDGQSCLNSSDAAHTKLFLGDTPGTIREGESNWKTIFTTAAAKLGSCENRRAHGLWQPGASLPTGVLAQRRADLSAADPSRLHAPRGQTHG